jgi:hypothetical protein
VAISRAQSVEISNTVHLGPIAHHPGVRRSGDWPCSIILDIYLARHSGGFAGTLPSPGSRITRTFPRLFLPASDGTSGFVHQFQAQRGPLPLLPTAPYSCQRLHCLQRNPGAKLSTRCKAGETVDNQLALGETASYPAALLSASLILIEIPGDLLLVMRPFHLLLSP